MKSPRMEPKAKTNRDRTNISKLYNQTMRAIDFRRALKVSAAAALLAAGGALHAQNAPATPSTPATAQQPAPDKPVITPPSQGGVIRRSFDIVSTDVIVRDNKNQ